MRTPSAVELRLGVLAVSVLHDVDVDPSENGVVLPGWPDVWVPWSECRRALAGHDPESEEGRTRLAAWLLARRWCADVGPVELRDMLRPVGLPVDHFLHPGLDWVCERVLGDVLDLGFGAVGLDGNDLDKVVLVPPSALDHAGIDAGAAWLDAAAYLEDMGRLAVTMARRDARGQLRPIGDCDVVTLLGARSLRTGLAADHDGLGAAVVPMRRRGWTQLALIDPAFGPAAARATSPAERGFDRPLLITADEVTQVPDGGRPQLALRENLDEPWLRDVLYR
ncbi:MAG: hypothetical protein JWN57_2425 [Frankiales bacterium]|nr:hypothetical protein [Frankiales bacterium]